MFSYFLQYLRKISVIGHRIFLIYAVSSWLQIYVSNTCDAEFILHVFYSGHLMHRSCECNGLSLLNCQVPLGLAITWAAAFLLTETGAYNYKECDVNVPVSNIISEHCRKHVSRMKQCRVDSSHALKSSPWFRFPYPLQWGTPVFHWKMAFVMCVVSVIASVDSVCLIFLLLLTLLLKFSIS